MGKRRQVRQVRKVKPRGIPAPAAPATMTSADQRKQREKYVASGGMLQGYSPELVLRIGLYAVIAAAVCLLIGLAFLFLLPSGLPVRAIAAIVWVVPIAFLVSFILPGYRLARRDRKQEPKLVQGQLMGASPVSNSLGLGMLMVKTRAGVENYLVPPDRIAKVPGNQVPVMITVTPLLRHVRSVGVMGQRMVGRADQPVPAVVRRLRLLPIVTPVALAGSAILGDDVTALLPIHPDLLHALLALFFGALLGAGMYGLSFLFQRRMYAEVQGLMPGAGP